MEILHVIPINATYIVPLANMLQRYDKDNKHTFMVTTPFQTVVKNNMNLLQIRGLQFVPIFKGNSFNKKMKFIKSRVKEADHVVWHTFATNEGYIPFLLYSNKSLLKKSTWIPYEGEIGSYMNVANKRLNRRVKRVNEYIQSHVRFVGLDHISDAEYLAQKSKGDRITTLLPYPNNREQNEVLARCIENNEPTIKNERPFVQVGLNSQSLNGHGEMIDILSEMADIQESIVFMQFFAALNDTRCAVGTKVYKNRITKKVNKLKCKCIFKNARLSADDYIKHLNRMDVVVLNNKITCQMPTLLSILALNKRVFINEESPIYNYLNELGANVYSFKDLIECNSLSQARDFPPSQIPEQLKSYYTEDNVYKLWEKWLNLINS